MAVFDEDFNYYRCDVDCCLVYKIEQPIRLLNTGVAGNYNQNYPYRIGLAAQFDT